MSEQNTLQSIPQHVAIIMDGNGRWAKAQGLKRFVGHQYGLESVRSSINTAAELGIKYLTLYAFSTENWSRPQSEVELLMGLMIDAVQKEKADLIKNNVRIRLIGQVERLPQKTRAKILQLQQDTAHCSGITVFLALSYSSRQEITDAVRKIAKQVKEGSLTLDEITETTIEQSLYAADIPNPDLLIRTSGEQRISNFLLWQIAYSELYFASCNWPDFNRKEFLKAIEAYAQRERRYGKTSEQVTP